MRLFRIRLLSDLVSWTLNSLYARLNDTLAIIKGLHCGLLSEISKLRRCMSYRHAPRIRVQFLLIPAVVISVVLSACFMTLNAEEVKADDSSVEKVTAYRNPFSLPSGVRFEERKEAVSDYSEYTEWQEGVVASSVNGIFQSGSIISANINGIWVKKGDWVGEEQVLEIETENVVLIGKENEKRNLPLRNIENGVKVVELVKSGY